MEDESESSIRQDGLGFSWRLLGLIGGALGGSADLLYVSILMNQQGGRPLSARGLFVSGLAAVLATSAIAASVIPRSARIIFPSGLLYGAASGFVVLGILGILSIGALWILAGLLCVVPAMRWSRSKKSVAICGLMIATITIGFSFTT